MPTEDNEPTVGEVIDNPEKYPEYSREMRRITEKLLSSTGRGRLGSSLNITSQLPDVSALGTSIHVPKIDDLMSSSQDKLKSATEAAQAAASAATGLITPEISKMIAQAKENSKVVDQIRKVAIPSGLFEGASKATLARTLGITSGRVSQIVSEPAKKHIAAAKEAALELEKIDPSALRGPSAGIVSELRELGEMFHSGLLTNEEFTRAKDRVLNPES